VSVLPTPVTRVLVVGLLMAACLAVTAPVGAPPTAEASTSTPVMSSPRVGASALTAWFRAHEPTGSTARASVPVEELARLYIEEGRAEGVAGDAAFVQAVIETGWFRWPRGQVTPEHNNFAGIGACDGGTCTVARFPDARTGVRAQIQHLRAYADPTVTERNLANPLVSPRFHLVSPKGMAPTWEQFGGGVWATDPLYGRKILDRYASLLAHAGARGTLGGASRTFSDVPSSHPHARSIAAVAERGITRGCGDGHTFCPDDTVTRGQVATFVTRAFDLPAGATGTFSDVGGVHAPGIEALAAAGITRGCGDGRFCPADGLTRAQMASLLARTLELPRGSSTFVDVPPGHAHGATISSLADAGITLGCSAQRFCPDEVVSRAQMASFLDRALQR
jgi:hypothetical protein